MPTLLLSRSDIRKLASWPLMIDAVRLALAARGDSSAAAAAAQLTLPHALLHLKAGALPAPAILSVKANLRVTGKAAAGVVVLYDTDAGAVTAILDSADITAMRTAALAVVAAQTLGPQGPVDLGLIGAGPVAGAVLDAMAHSFEVRSVRLWSRDPARAKALAATKPYTIELCATPGEAAAAASVVVTATPSRAPLLHASDFAAGALILALGADSPGKRELGQSVLAYAHIVADQIEDVLRVGECAFLPAPRGDLVELTDILGGHVLAKDAMKELIVFDSVGSALLDAAVCRSLLQSALGQQLGCNFAFSS